MDGDAALGMERDCFIAHSPAANSLLAMTGFSTGKETDMSATPVGTAMDAGRAAMMAGWHSMGGMVCLCGTPLRAAVNHWDCHHCGRAFCRECGGPIARNGGCDVCTVCGSGMCG